MTPMLTLQAYLSSLTAGSTNEQGEEWTLEDWISWPPDLFALTSLILQQTGSYIHTVLPFGSAIWPEDQEWQQTLRITRKKWYRWILGKGKFPNFLKKRHELLVGGWHEITIEQIRDLQVPSPNEPTPDQRRIWEVCKIILELHALADEACEGLGITAKNSWKEQPFRNSHKDKSKQHDRLDMDVKTIHGMANILLAYTGSLSRLPVSVVRVLPKLRTPNVGLTLRSFSHNVTMHQTEVDVMWRTMPWVNIDENTINMMIVPWPYTMEPTWFKPSVHTTPRNSSERTRYFEYEGSPTPFDPEKLLTMLQNAETSVHRIHLIVFPELALTEGNLEAILQALAKNKARDQVPMVLTGVRDSAPDDLGTNQVVLSTFFAGKWYQFKQDKHHRWRLDGKQIKQYNLGGALAGGKEWWEAIRISRRKLSVLAPNNWLALCPLICEDLARLEPVSEIIRGIGPTLLIAILLDGPQLSERWPSRYASVLADDPGTSVLTVSALGLTKRSLNDYGGGDGLDIVALWKDSVTGARTIPIQQSEKLKDGASVGVVLTISAHWKEEFTSDGRGDGGNGALFVLQGIHSVNDIDVGNRQAEPKLSDEGNWAYQYSDEPDFLEITLFSYFVDAVLDASDSVVEAVTHWVLGERADGDMESFKLQDSLLQRIQISKDRLLPKNREDDVTPFVKWLSHLIRAIKIPTSREPEPIKYMPYYRAVYEYVYRILTLVEHPRFMEFLRKNVDPLNELREAGLNIPTDEIFGDDIPNPSLRVRIYVYTSLVILWAVHIRLNDLRLRGLLKRDGAELIYDIENLLQKDFDQYWYKARREFGQR